MTARRNPRTRAIKWRYRIQSLDERGRWIEVAGRDVLAAALEYVSAQILTTSNGSFRIREGRRTISTWLWKSS